VRKVSAHISGIDLGEGALPVVQINLCFSLNEVLSILGLRNPVPVILADADADVDEVG